MKRGTPPAHHPAPAFCTAALVGIGLLVFPAGNVHAQFFKNLFSKDIDRAPSAPEMQLQESKAESLYSAAERAEAAGDRGKALALARKVVSQYPLTRSASKAQFKAAELLEKDGKLIKAFNEYQEFLTTYRQSPQFAAAIDRQFRIACVAMDEKASSFLGVMKMETQRSQVIEMFNKVIANAPRSPFAVQAQFRIGEIHEQEKETREAVAAFQKVVDDYPGSELSAEAAYRMANVNLATVERSKDSSNVRSARQDLESAVTLFPESEQHSEAIEALSTLDETEAAKSMNTAQFYEKRGHAKAAAIYYMDVARSGTSHAAAAREKLTALPVEDLDLGPLLPGAQGDQLDTLSFPSRDGSEASAGLLGATAPSFPTVKTRPDYLGPPAPDLDRLLQKPRMRTDLTPTFQSNEPPLPSPPQPGEDAAGSFLEAIDTGLPLTEPPAAAPAPPLPDAPSLDDAALPEPDRESADSADVGEQPDNTNEEAAPEESEDDEETPAPADPDPAP